MVPVHSLGDANITSDSQPILRPIEMHVERLNKHRLANIRQAAKAASLLLAVRKAIPAGVSASATSDTIQRYQEALKLLQDPILAVRAHGLMILQSIVRASDFDRALTPAIMDIFLSAIRDDDSFMYLNAIKGLSSLVDGIGAEVMNSISQAYVEGLDRNLDFKADELDRRLRLGEALQQSIRRAGAALSGYSKLLDREMFHRQRLISVSLSWTYCTSLATTFPQPELAYRDSELVPFHPGNLCGYRVARIAPLVQ
jgi:hypothetical protein